MSSFCLDRMRIKQTCERFQSTSQKAPKEARGRNRRHRNCIEARVLRPSAKSAAAADVCYLGSDSETEEWIHFFTALIKMTKNKVTLTN